jgi:MAF protein
MISWAGWQVEPAPPQIDETIQPDESPEAYVRRIAVQKCLKPIHPARDGDTIIAADTIVVAGEKILGKPADAAEAFEMLAHLRGNIHWVITALAVRKNRDEQTLLDICRSEVKMRPYSDDEIQAYIGSGDPFDKAGAYAIQDAVFSPAEHFRGCFASVMGLPLCHLERTLRQYDGYLPTEWAEACQKQLKYTCPITARVMAGEDIG